MTSAERKSFLTQRSPMAKLLFDFFDAVERDASWPTSPRKETPCSSTRLCNSAVAIAHNHLTAVVLWRSSRASRHHLSTEGPPKNERATPRRRHNDSCAARNESATGPAPKCPENRRGAAAWLFRSKFEAAYRQKNAARRCVRDQAQQSSSICTTRSAAKSRPAAPTRSRSSEVFRRSSDAHGIIPRQKRPLGAAKPGGLTVSAQPVSHARQRQKAFRESLKAFGFWSFRSKISSDLVRGIFVESSRGPVVPAGLSPPDFLPRSPLQRVTWSRSTNQKASHSIASPFVPIFFFEPREEGRRESMDMR